MQNHSIAAVVLAASLSACSGSPSPRPQEPAQAVSALPSHLALRWAVSGAFGGETFEIASQGNAHYRPVPGPRQDWASPSAGDGVLTQQDRQTLAQSLAAADCCGLRSSRETGHMDETRPALDLHLGSSNCHVELWSQEWQEMSQAQACLKPVQALKDRIAGPAKAVR
jgi:hypothetical protein